MRQNRVGKNICMQEDFYELKHVAPKNRSFRSIMSTFPLNAWQIAVSLQKQIYGANCFARYCNVNAFEIFSF